MSVRKYMDIKKYILQIIKDDDTKKNYLELYKFLDISDDSKIYMIAKMLRSQAKEEIDTKNFAHEFEGLITTLVPMREAILLCHLIIEHYMDKYLKVIFPNSFNLINNAPKFTFDQKLHMCVASNSPLMGFYKEIKELNAMRNKYVHNLNYNAPSDFILKLKKNTLFKNFYPDNQSLEDENILMIFTRFLCSVMYGYTQEEMRCRKDIFLPSYKGFL